MSSRPPRCSPISTCFPPASSTYRPALALRRSKPPPNSFSDPSCPSPCPSPRKRGEGTQLHNQALSPPAGRGWPRARARGRVRGKSVVGRSGATKQSRYIVARMGSERSFATRRITPSVVLVLLLASLTGCLQPAPPLSESTSEARGEAIYVLRGGWHTELALPMS